MSLVFSDVTSTKFGRYQVAEPMRLENLHLHSGAPLKEVSWEIPIPVLDQEDLLAQGIDTSVLVPGAARVDALGSCTANATTASLAERYVSTGRELPAGISAGNAKTSEEYAISFYHACTDQTGTPSQEWPPTDCGSTGLYCCQELQKQNLISSYRTGSAAMSALSLLQSGTVIQGTPWFNSWFQPDSQGFVDGDGSLDALQAAAESGVAGGHETCQHAIVQLAQASSGVDLQNTYIKVRNSWSPSFALSGDFLLHASTLNYLSHYVDYKQFVL
jgi:hypothetical protein